MEQGTSTGFATRRRGELFDKLVALFLDEGFADLTLDDISGRLRCSKSTLYALADSKEQLVTAAAVHFFKQATTDVEAGLADVSGARDRIATYVSGVGTALSVASDAFISDLNGFAPTRDIYQRNTRIAARRVQELIDEGVAAGEFRDVHAAFIADVAASTMARIQQGDIRINSGLDDASAYHELSALLTAGLSA